VDLKPKPKKGENKMAKQKKEFPTVTITQQEMKNLMEQSRGNWKVFFSALRALSAERGILYYTPMDVCLHTEFDKNKNFIQKNFIRELPPDERVKR
jgi:hypothetical protein